MSFSTLPPPLPRHKPSPYSSTSACIHRGCRRAHIYLRERPSNDDRKIHRAPLNDLPDPYGTGRFLYASCNGVRPSTARRVFRVVRDGQDAGRSERPPPRALLFRRPVKSRESPPANIRQFQSIDQRQSTAVLRRVVRKTELKTEGDGRVKSGGAACVLLRLVSRGIRGAFNFFPYPLPPPLSLSPSFSFSPVRWCNFFFIFRESRT